MIAVRHTHFWKNKRHGVGELELGYMSLHELAAASTRGQGKPTSNERAGHSRANFPPWNTN